MIVTSINMLLLVIFILYLFWIYKKGQKLKTKIQNAFETLDVYLKHRYELVPELLENIKSVLQTQEKLLLKIKELVKYDYSTLTKEEKLKLNGRLTTGLKKLFEGSLKIEDLQSNAEFNHLKIKISDIEDTIEKSRKNYNHEVKEYNEYLQKLPHCIFTPLFKYNYEEPFENFSNKHKYED